jgi:hypothetical protein
MCYCSFSFHIELLVHIECDVNVNYKISTAFSFHVTASPFLVESKVATLMITKQSGAAFIFKSGSATFDLFMVHAEIVGVIHFRHNEFCSQHTVNKLTVHRELIVWRLDYGYQYIFAQVVLNHFWLNDDEHISDSLLSSCAMFH